jgi:predicted nuclease with TOPRIM domain
VIRKVKEENNNNLLGDDFIMKTLLKVTAVVTGFIGAANIIAQGNHNNRNIKRLHERNNELQDKLYNMQSELSDAKWEASRVRSDVNWIEKMRKIENKEQKELRAKLHKLTLENIDLQGKVDLMEIRGGFRNSLKEAVEAN